MNKLFIKTYGCEMNIYDSIKMEEIFNQLAVKSTDNINDADIVILNTCHIRKKASEKLYSELGRVKKIKDKRLLSDKVNMIIIVAGCVGQAEGEEIFSYAPYVDIVVGPQSYHTLPRLISELKESKKHLINLDFVEEKKFDNLPLHYSSENKVCAFISIQEGCNKFCTFCVVPYTRGAEFSRMPEAIYRESIALVTNGTKEINFLGQNVNAYYAKSSKWNKIFSLADLIRYISSIKGLERIRYTTSHPKDMSDDLISIHGDISQLMPFLHLPVQSGSNKILKMMNRKHTREEYFLIIDKLRAVRPDIVFSSDFIVGFPGETDKDFDDTIDLIKRVKYGQSYSFKYSPRPGTPAAIKEQISEQTKNKRLTILQKELSKQRLEFNESCVGKILPVLFQKEGKYNGEIVGKSPYMQSTYIPYSGECNKQLIGRIANVKITQGLEAGLMGKLI